MTRGCQLYGASGCHFGGKLSNVSQLVLCALPGLARRHHLASA